MATWSQRGQRVSKDKPSLLGKGLWYMQFIYKGCSELCGHAMRMYYSMLAQVTPAIGAVRTTTAHGRLSLDLALLHPSKSADLATTSRRSNQSLQMSSGTSYSS